MTPLAIAGIAIVAAIVLIAALFKLLWKVPAADQALIVTGLGASKTSAVGRTFKIVTGGGAMVIPALQSSAPSRPATALQKPEVISRTRP